MKVKIHIEFTNVIKMTPCILYLLLNSLKISNSVLVFCFLYYYKTFRRNDSSWSYKIYRSYYNGPIKSLWLYSAWSFLAKLNSYDFTNAVTTLIASYLSNRRQFVKLGYVFNDFWDHLVDHSCVHMRYLASFTICARIAPCTTLLTKH